MKSCSELVKREAEKGLDCGGMTRFVARDASRARKARTRPRTPKAHDTPVRKAKLRCDRRPHLRGGIVAVDPGLSSAVIKGRE